MAWLGNPDEAGRLGVQQAVDVGPYESGMRDRQDAGKNSRAAKLFDVTVTKTDKNAARIEWSKVEATRDWTTLSAGRILLRTNVADWSDEELWKAFFELTEAEAAFRIHKSDLSIPRSGIRKRSVCWLTSSCASLHRN